MMTAKSRYWDHESCSWVTYESTAVTSTPCGTDEVPVESVPEQRADDDTSPAHIV